MRPLVILCLLAVWLALPVAATQAQCSGDSCQAYPVLKASGAIVSAGGQVAGNVVERGQSVVKQSLRTARHPLATIRADRPGRRLAKFIRVAGRLRPCRR